MTIIPYFSHMFESYYILFYLALIGLMYYTKDKWLTVVTTIINMVVFLDMVSFGATMLDFVVYAVFLILNLKVLFDILEGKV